MGSCQEYGVPVVLVTKDALDSAKTIIGNVQSMANSAYGNALGLLSAITGVIDSGDVNTNVTLDPISIPSFNSYLGALPVAPDLGDIPDTPNVSYDYNEAQYTSNLHEALNNVLISEIINGSTGLTETVENAIYDRESERDLQELADTKTRMAALWAETNSPLPDAVLYANQYWADIRYQNAKSDKSRDVRIESFKRADDNAKFVKDLSARYEGIIRDYTGKYWERQLKKASDIVNYAILIYNAYIEWKKALVQLYAAEAQAYQAKAMAVAALAEVTVKEIDARVRYAVAKADVQVKGIEAQIELVKGKIQAAVAAASGIAQVASHLASGAMSAVSAQAQVSYDGRDSNSASVDQKTICSEEYRGKSDD